MSTTTKSTDIGKDQQSEQITNSTPDNGAADTDEGTDFKVTIRKIEGPIRPRGVLAE